MSAQENQPEYEAQVESTVGVKRKRGNGTFLTQKRAFESLVIAKSYELVKSVLKVNIESMNVLMKINDELTFYKKSITYWKEVLRSMESSTFEGAELEATQIAHTITKRGFAHIHWPE